VGCGGDVGDLGGRKGMRKIKGQDDERVQMGGTDGKLKEQEGESDRRNSNRDQKWDRGDRGSGRKGSGENNEKNDKNRGGKVENHRDVCKWGCKRKVRGNQGMRKRDWK